MKFEKSPQPKHNGVKACQAEKAVKCRFCRGKGKIQGACDCTACLLRALGLESFEGRPYFEANSLPLKDVSEGQLFQREGLFLVFLNGRWYILGPSLGTVEEAGIPVFVRGRRPFMKRL